MGRVMYVLHSALTPESVAEALTRSIDEERWTVFSPSGYRGDRPLLGEVSDNTFRVQKRRWSRNDFAPHFYARFGPEHGGTRIEGYFDTRPWAKYFMWIWLGFAVLIGTPIFIATAIDITTGSYHSNGEAWVGLVVPPALVLFGIVLPKVGRLAGRADRPFILEQLQKALGAHVVH
jgi:hypothetical protein